jgi:hypothetical protein
MASEMTSGDAARTESAATAREALDYERALHLQALKGQGARDLDEAMGAVDAALESLARENERLREALRPFAEAADRMDDGSTVYVPAPHFFAARAALAGEGVNYAGIEASVECAYPPCTNRLRRSNFEGPQWCSREHREATLAGEGE